MNAASALIGGLGGEKERWTEQSKMFQAQLTKYIMSFHVIVVTMIILQACGRCTTGNRIFILLWTI